MQLRNWPLLAVLAAPLLAQVSVSLGSVTVPNEVAVALEAWRLKQFVLDPGFNPQITLTAPMLATDTTMMVSDASKLAAGNQVVIEAEALDVVSIAVNVVTVTRARALTTAAAHAAGLPARALKYASIPIMLRSIMREKVASIVTEEQPTTGIAAQQAAIDAAQTAIQNIKKNVLQ